MKLEIQLDREGTLTVASFCKDGHMTNMLVIDKKDENAYDMQVVSSYYKGASQYKHGGFAKVSINERIERAVKEITDKV